MKSKITKMIIVMKFQFNILYMLTRVKKIKNNINFQVIYEEDGEIKILNLNTDLIYNKIELQNH